MNHPLRCLVLLSFVGCLAACGGGSGADGGGDAQAPADLDYGDTQFSIQTDAAFSLPASFTGDPTSWTVDPTLPDGLVLGQGGGISGVPTSPAPATQYRVTAANEVGEASVVLTIEVAWADFRSLDPRPLLTEDDIRFFLERTHFGFTEFSLQQIVNTGFANYVQSITTFQDTTALEQEAEVFLQREFDPTGRFPTQQQVAQWCIHVMTNNPNPFQEALALHWHNHFATSSAPGLAFTRFMVDHINLWRHQGTGNLRQLLIDMSRDAAMLIWLDGILNDAGEGKEPNENFSREFFELYCLGADIDYTEADIQEAARAFSGYQLVFDLDLQRFVAAFNHERHDHGEKNLLGGTIPAQPAGPGEQDDYEAVVDLTLALSDPESGAPRVGQWIVRNLLEHFCFDDPPQNVVDELATQLRNDGWELRPMIQRMLTSKMFFSDRARAGRVKGPADSIFGFMRATGLRVTADKLEPFLTTLKHVPTMPPSVNGWPGGSTWLGVQTTINMANLVHFVTQTEQTAQIDQDMRVTALLPSAIASAAEVVDALAKRLQITLNAAERARAIEYLETERLPSLLPTPSPWDPQDETKTEERMRGLLWVLCQHPTYTVR